MFQRKIDEIFKGLQNIFGKVDDPLIVRYDANDRDHNRTLRWVMQICHLENLRLNKSKYHFRWTKIRLFREVITREGVKLDPKNLCALLKISPPTNEKELQSFLGIMSYIQKFSSSIAEVYKPLRKLTSSKFKLTWNNTYQNLYNRAKNIIKKNEAMGFYNEKGQLYLETDALCVGVGACLLQSRDRMWFPWNEAPNNTTLWPITLVHKSLTSADTCYSNIDREGLDILHGLEKYHHHCLTLEVSMIDIPQTTGSNI